MANSVQDAYHPIRVADNASMPEEPANTSVPLPEGVEPLTLGLIGGDQRSAAPAR